jgi:hydroxymethylpyrimidine pyrophosphatase-like HAD family hydrolase
MVEHNPVQKVVFFDIDGTVVGRNGLKKQYKAERDLREDGPVIFEAPERVPAHPHQISDRGFKLTEIFSYLGHKLRSVSHKTRDAMQEASNQGVIFYGNTGRWATKGWKKITDDTLKKGQINHYVTDIYQRPLDWQTADSKIAAIEDIEQKYKLKGEPVEIYHIEDNFREGAQIALKHPEVTVIMVKDQSTAKLFATFNTRMCVKGINVNNIVFVDNFAQGIREHVLK